MAKIQYLQGTHDGRAGDIRDVAQPCAEVLVRLRKAEYITARRPAGQKKKHDAEHSECGTFCDEPEKTRNQDVM
ncbi:hypothetical protein [Escherichia coli]|uniref:hypothetical protein n=1 Tax=Escherichia coli TaxID=562 RepID=UPI0015D50591|nr:hypothetical protein [Escherichia coli]NYW24312.1 hypothetical protein [Escherichia coli]